ncbi:hypothetical protein [Curtobacterium sp. MWU13-2055]|uniref:hypothetical protein n=1 Tax=Curtobacterium sp. MWU13-2055 TaxID=2931928 RepID=UPI00200E4A72|nr:hypothetical protein [Curtobacterium sp. MWU13-2055]
MLLPADSGPWSGWASAAIAVLALVVSILTFVATTRKNLKEAKRKTIDDLRVASSVLRSPSVQRAIEEIEGSAEAIRLRKSEYDNRLRTADPASVPDAVLEERIRGRHFARNGDEFGRAYGQIAGAIITAASYVPPEIKSRDVPVWRQNGRDLYLLVKHAVGSLAEPRWELKKLPTLRAMFGVESELSDAALLAAIATLNRIRPDDTEALILAYADE